MVLVYFGGSRTARFYWGLIKYMMLVPV